MFLAGKALADKSEGLSGPQDSMSARRELISTHMSEYGSTCTHTHTYTHKCTK